MTPFTHHLHKLCWKLMGLSLLLESPFQSVISVRAIYAFPLLPIHTAFIISTTLLQIYPPVLVLFHPSSRLDNLAVLRFIFLLYVHDIHWFLNTFSLFPIYLQYKSLLIFLNGYKICVVDALKTLKQKEANVILYWLCRYKWLFKEVAFKKRRSIASPPVQQNCTVFHEKKECSHIWKAGT